jgi:hypothetical protein
MRDSTAPGCLSSTLGKTPSRRFAWGKATRISLFLDENVSGAE